ncbi:MAG: DUF983 domain-containing protein [Chitinophagales bacterium]
MSDVKWRYVFTLKCPSCGKSPLYIAKSSFNFSKFMDMHDNCSACKEDFAVEPGFYQGAMYISYILSCALCLSLLPIYVLFNTTRDAFLDNALYYLFGCFAMLLLTAPYLTRLSRAIWLTLHIRFLKNKDY